MIVRPIPKHLLVHSVEYQEYLEDGRWGDSFADPVTVSFVRVEPASSLDRDSSKEEIVAENVLFIDRVHSQPFILPKQKDRIIFDGREFEVHRVEVFYAIGDRIHHVEVELV